MRYISHGTTRSIDEVRASLEKKIRCLAEHGVTMFTVIERDTGTIIGDCGAIPIAWEGPEFEFGYRLAAPAWGKGYATEAGRAALPAVWAKTAFERLIGITDPRNAASQRVLTKLGFTDRGETTDYYHGERLRWFTIDRPPTEPANDPE